MNFDFRFITTEGRWFKSFPRYQKIKGLEEILTPFYFYPISCKHYVSTR